MRHIATYSHYGICRMRHIPSYQAAAVSVFVPHRWLSSFGNTRVCANSLRQNNRHQGLRVTGYSHPQPSSAQSTREPTTDDRRTTDGRRRQRRTTAWRRTGDDKPTDDGRQRQTTTDDDGQTWECGHSAHPEKGKSMELPLPAKSGSSIAGSMFVVFVTSIIIYASCREV